MSAITVAGRGPARASRISTRPPVAKRSIRQRCRLPNVVLSSGYGSRREPAVDNAPMPGVQRRIDVLELVLEIGLVAGQQLGHPPVPRPDRATGAGGDGTELCRHRSPVPTARPVGGEDRREVLGPPGDVDQVVVAGDDQHVVRRVRGRPGIRVAATAANEYGSSSTAWSIVRIRSACTLGGIGPPGDGLARPRYPGLSDRSSGARDGLHQYGIWFLTDAPPGTAARRAHLVVRRDESGQAVEQLVHGDGGDADVRV